MRAAIAIVVAALVGCGTWESQERARTVAAEAMECPGVTVEPIGDDRFHATGCGEEIDVACTSGGNEPRCERVRLRRAGAETAGGEITVREIETGTETGAAGRAPGAGSGGPDVGSGAPGAGSASVDPAAEGALRAAIDARRDDVLACAGGDRVVVRVRTDANGAARITLGGALAGRPEEGCVRAALADLTGPASIEVIHLVRAP